MDIEKFSDNETICENSFNYWDFIPDNVCWLLCKVFIENNDNNNTIPIQQ